jgi:diguanylate cyclase (GGDEF)-like protein
MITLLVFAFLFEIWRTPEQLAMTYVLLVMCAFGPPTLAWRPFLVAATAMVIAASLVARTWAGPQWLDWTLASIAAVTISAVLLRTRLRSVDLLADASALVQRLATTDELTGLINRHGLTLQLTSLVANATRYDQPLFVAFVDVVGLKAANDRHGHDFGDDVIQCVARAVSNAVRDGDLVARWGGDEFIVVGLGSAPDPRVLSDRLHASIARSGINLDQWTGRVSLGLAETAGQHIDVDELISAADEDMYRRRFAP